MEIPNEMAGKEQATEKKCTDSYSEQNSSIKDKKMSEIKYLDIDMKEHDKLLNIDRNITGVVDNDDLLKGDRPTCNEHKEQGDVKFQPALYDNPVDHGWAWMVLTSTFLICMLTIGGIKSFGVLLVELSRVFDLPKTLLSIVQSLAGFFFLALGPISNALSVRYTFQKMIIIGGLFTSVGLILTSYANSIEVIFLTYGVLTGTGFGFTFSPSLVFLSHHFNQRRALANGIALSGGGLGSIIFPYLMRFLIDTFTLKGCMLILSAVMSHIIVCGALFRPLHEYPSKYVKKHRGNDSPDVLHVVSEKLLKSESGHEINTVESNKAMNIMMSSFRNDQNSYSHTSLNVQCLPESPVSRFLSQESVNGKSSSKHLLQPINTALCASLGALSSVSYQNIPNSIDPLNQMEAFEIEVDEKDSQCKCIKTSFLGVMKWSLFKNPQFVTFFCYICLINICYHCIFNCLPSYAEENSLSDTEGALLITVLSSLDLCGRIFIGWISDIFVNYRQHFFIACSLLSGLGIMFVPEFSSFVELCVWLSCFAVFLGGYNGLMVTVIVDSFGIQHLSSAWGFSCFSASFGLFLNPIVTGTLRDWSGGWNLAFRVGGASGIFASLLFLSGSVFRSISEKKT